MTAANTGAPETAAEEKQTNCLGCNKPLKKMNVYYRNGKYYCDKKCWKKAKAAPASGEGKK